MVLVDADQNSIGGSAGRSLLSFFTPDVITEECTELGVPYRANGYRYWTSS